MAERLPTTSDEKRGMALPDRFRNATFENYEPTTPSQLNALGIARNFVQEVAQSTRWIERLKKFWQASTTHSSGLYLVGPAGTGKTHLLAATYNALSPEVPCAFLHSSELFRQTEPPKAFANRLAKHHHVCFLDEVEIDDPANEMRLVQVMRTLADQGVPLFATSNVEPDQYLSKQFSKGRFRRFLRREFHEQYQIVFVGGNDYRRNQQLEQRGNGWIGPRDQTKQQLEQVRQSTTETFEGYNFKNFRTKVTEVAHTQVIANLTNQEHLFIENVSISGTDDALRILRVIDALYLHDDAPALHFTATHPPETWFTSGQHDGVAQAIAEKFERTVSRLHAMCDIQRVSEGELV